MEAPKSTKNGRSILGINSQTFGQKRSLGNARFFVKKKVGEWKGGEQKIWMKIQYSLLVFLSLTSTLLAQTDKLPDTLPLFGSGPNNGKMPPTAQVDAKTGEKVYLREDIKQQLTPKGKYKPNKKTVLSLLGQPDKIAKYGSGGDVWAYLRKSKDPISGKIDSALRVEFLGPLPIIARPVRPPTTSRLGAMGGAVGGVVGNNYYTPKPEKRNPDEVASVKFIR